MWSYHIRVSHLSGRLVAQRLMPRTNNTTRQGSSTKALSLPASTRKAKASIFGTLLLLAAISDPVISALENSKKDVNVSYWKTRQPSDKNEQSGGTQGCRLRNANSNNGAATVPPKYSRVVIVGGGMAGLHTALCLAERMNSSASTSCDQKSSDRTRWWGPFRRESQQEAEELQREQMTEIIVLEGQEIGNGASGRAKGLVVPGFQVPLENLEMNAFDYESTENAYTYTLPSILRTIQTTLGIPEATPRYSKAVVREMYAATYVALERLRNVVKRYGIDCGWVECGAVEGSIHPREEDDEDGQEEEERCILNCHQVNRMMGRPSDESEEKSLYKWGEYDSDCAGVNPLALTVGLADAVEGWGVKIYEYAKVDKLEKTAPSKATRANGRSADAPVGKYTLTTKDGHTIRCEHVVLCTGAESSLSKRLSSSFVPIYTWMAATESLYDKCPLQPENAQRVLSELDSGEQGAKQQFSSAAPMCGDDHFALNYWRDDNAPSKRLLFGSICDTYSSPSAIVKWRLRNALAEVYPQLSQVKFDHVWGGKLAVAMNAMPLIGRDIDYDDGIDCESENSSDIKDVTKYGVWYSTGFAGHGIVPAALAGSVIANAILGIPDRVESENVNDTSTKMDVPQQQLWQLFHTYFPPVSWNGYPCSRMGAGAVFCVYNLFDWLGKKGVPVPRLPEIW